MNKYYLVNRHSVTFYTESQRATELLQKDNGIFHWFNTAEEVAQFLNMPETDAADVEMFAYEIRSDANHDFSTIIYDNSESQIIDNDNLIDFVYD